MTPKTKNSVGKNLGKGAVGDISYECVFQKLTIKISYETEITLWVYIQRKLYHLWYKAALPNLLQYYI